MYAYDLVSFLLCQSHIFNGLCVSVWKCVCVICVWMAQRTNLKLLFASSMSFCCRRCLYCIFSHRYPIVLFLSFSLCVFTFAFHYAPIFLIISVVDHIFLFIVHTLVVRIVVRQKTKINKQFSHTTNNQITMTILRINMYICITNKYAHWSQAIPETFQASERHTAEEREKNRNEEKEKEKEKVTQLRKGVKLSSKRTKKFAAYDCCCSWLLLSLFLDWDCQCETQLLRVIAQQQWWKVITLIKFKLVQTNKNMYEKSACVNIIIETCKNNWYTQRKI